jgi:hypothetical protein
MVEVSGNPAAGPPKRRSNSAKDAMSVAIPTGPSGVRPTKAAIEVGAPAIAGGPPGSLPHRRPGSGARASAWAAGQAFAFTYSPGASPSGLSLPPPGSRAGTRSGACFSSHANQ